MPQNNPAHQGGQFKYYPMLDRTIARILRVEVKHKTLPTTRSMIMGAAQLRLSQGGLSRRMAELHTLRFLICESEVRHGQ